MANKTNSTKATKAEGTMAKATKKSQLAERNAARVAALEAKKAAKAEAERAAKLAARPVSEARPLGTKRATKAAAPRSSAARVLAKAAAAEARLAAGVAQTAPDAAPAPAPAPQPLPAPAPVSEASSPARRRSRRAAPAPEAPATPASAPQTAPDAPQTPPSAPSRRRRGPAPLPAPEPASEAAGATPAPAAPEVSPAVAEAVRVGSPDAVRQRTIALCLECSLLGDERRVSSDTDAVQTEADRKLVTVTKRLIECEEYDRIRVLRRQAADIVRVDVAFPSFFKPGIFLVPVSKVRLLEERLRAKRDEFNAAVEAFVAVYPQRVEAMRERLGPLFNSADYPAATTLARRFSLTWRYLDLDAPQSRLRAIDPELAAEDAAHAADFWREAADGVARLLRGTALKLAERLQDVLTPGPDGKPRAFRRAAVEGLLDFLQVFQQNNVADDRDLAAAVERAQACLADVDIDHLKTDEAARAELARRFDGVREQLAGLTQARGAREVVLPAA